MSAIRRPDRGDEWWVDFEFRGKRVRRRSPMQTKTGAREFEEDLRRELRLGSGADTMGAVAVVGAPPGSAATSPSMCPPAPGPSEMTFAEFVPRWMTDYVGTRNRPGTGVYTERVMRLHLLPALGDLPLSEITTARVDALIGALKDSGLKPKSVNNFVSILRCSLGTAQEWGLLNQLPKVRRLRVPNMGYRYLTGEQAARLLTAPRSLYWRTLLTFFLHTGARSGEVAALTWADVEIDVPVPSAHLQRSATRAVSGPTKTNRPRTLALTSALVALLREHREHHPDPSYVFSVRPGVPARFDNMRPKLGNLCARAGVPSVSWHHLRHTFATDLTANGVSLRVVQEALGHTTVQMTSRYAHVDASMIRGAISRLTYSNSSHAASDPSPDPSPDPLPERTCCG